MYLKGNVHLPGDKSISHRAIMFSSVAEGKSVLKNVLMSEDTLSTLRIFRQLGVNIAISKDEMTVYGKGFEGLKPTNEVLDCGNSGTTARLLMGLLSGLPIDKPLILTGDASLKKRPMLRVTKHLKKLGCKLELANNEYLPAIIHPSPVVSSHIVLDIASAQVKSAVILAALKSNSVTQVTEKLVTRNHTELMLQAMNCDLNVDGLMITVSGKKPLMAQDLTIPGDISSAAFFIVAALIIPNSDIVIKDCGINPTRTGIFRVLDQIGADYHVNNERLLGNELVGDVRIIYTKSLLPFHIGSDLVPQLIDEIPVLALLATQITGESVITGAEELRVKESDRISAVTNELTKLGGRITETPDGMIIKGGTTLCACVVNSYKDHRLSMMLKVAALLTGPLEIIDKDCDSISYPHFEADLAQITVI